MISGQAALGVGSKGNHGMRRRRLLRSLGAQAALGIGPNGNHGMRLRRLLRTVGAPEPTSGANLGVLVIGTKRHPQQPAGARLGRDSLRCYQQMFCLRKAMPMRILGC